MADVSLVSSILNK